MSALDVTALSQSFGSILLGILLRSSVLVIAGVFLVVLFRSRTAELRHFVYHGMLYGLLLLPVVECAAPPFRHPSATLIRAELAMLPDQPTTFSTRTTPAYVKVTIRQARPFQPMLLATALYVFVASTLLLRLALNLFRLNRLANRSEPILDPDLRELGHEIWLESLSRYKPQIRGLCGSYLGVL